MEQLAYIRVSTTDQHTDRQLAECPIKFDRTFEDKCSGATTERPELEALKRHVRSGDVIYVHSIDRLARSLVDLQTLVTDWNNQGVSVRFFKEGLNFDAGSDSATSSLMLGILGAVAQFERSIIKERQREGIAKAKAKGVYKGKPTNKDLHASIMKLHADGLSIRKVASELGCNPSTVQRVLKQQSH